MKHLLLIFITMCFISCQQYNSKTGVLVLVNDSLYLSYKGQMYANEHMVLRSLQKQGKHVNDWLGDPTGINVKISKKSKHVMFLYVMGSAPIQAHTSAFAKLTHLEQLNFETTDIQSIESIILKQPSSFPNEAYYYSMQDHFGAYRPYSKRQHVRFVIKK